jgi:HAD superfamily hydrolase (TIGR01509 family)
MALKAVLFDFNGIIINDESIHFELINEVLLTENLLPLEKEFRNLCLGRSDRACLIDVLSLRGRVVSEAYINKLIALKAGLYQERIERLEPLPIYSDFTEFLLKIADRGLSIGLVSGALREQIEFVLEKINLKQYFETIVAGDDINTSKPAPDGYLLAIDKLCQQKPELELVAANCLAIEDTFAGIQSAKNAGVRVVGVANTYPLHMLQRQANWAVDSLTELELDRIKELFIS